MKTIKYAATCLSVFILIICTIHNSSQTLSVKSLDSIYLLPADNSDLYLPFVANSISPIIPNTTNVLGEDSIAHLISISADYTTFVFYLTLDN